MMARNYFSSKPFWLIMCVFLYAPAGWAQNLDDILDDPLGDLETPAEFSTTTIDNTVRTLLEPVQSAIISSEMTGKITRIHKKDGQTFKKGDRLVTFECRSNEIEHTRLKAKLNSAKLIYENALQLESLNSIGELDVGLAEADTRIAEAEIAVAAYNVSRCAINAPFSGRVIELARKPHEWIDIGEPLMEIFNDKNYTLKMLIPSNWLVWLKVGTPFTVSIDETGKTYDAKITTIGAKIDPVSRSVTVRGKITNKDKNFIHSMSGNAVFTPETNTAEQ